MPWPYPTEIRRGLHYMRSRVPRKSSVAFQDYRVNHGDPVHGCGARLPAVVARHAQRSGRAVRSRWRAEPGRRARRQSVPRRSHLRFHHIQRCRKLFYLRSNASRGVEVSPIALCQNEHQISEINGQMLPVLHQRNNEYFNTIKIQAGANGWRASFVIWRCNSFENLPVNLFLIYTFLSSEFE
uniref:Uncharacterized protein n=1 Tax=Trichogramma kaykai TaxID=54128 RepID=A0ABD2WBX4_9HYME